MYKSPIDMLVTDIQHQIASQPKEDFDNQRKAYRLIVKHLEGREGE